MSVLSLCLGFGAVAGAWVFFVHNMRIASPGALDLFKKRGLVLTYAGFAKSIYFKSNSVSPQGSLSYCDISAGIRTSNLRHSGRLSTLCIFSILARIFGVAASAISMYVLVASIFALFSNQSNSFTLAVPKSNLLSVCFALCCAILFHELGHYLFMLTTRTPILKVTFGISLFVPFVSIVGDNAVSNTSTSNSSTAQDRVDRAASDHKKAINAVGGVVGNIVSALLAIAFAYCIAQRTKQRLHDLNISGEKVLSSTSALVYIGDAAHGLTPYSHVHSLGGYTISTHHDLQTVLTAIEKKHTADYSNIEVYIDSKNTISLTTGVFSTFGEHLGYSVHGDVTDSKHFWPAHTATQSTGGIQIPYTALKDIEPLQCHAHQNGMPVFLAHYHTISSAHILVLSPHIMGSTALQRYLTNENAQLCHYSTPEYMCIYPYLTKSYSAGVPANGFYVNSTIDGTYQMMPLPITPSRQTLVTEGWKAWYQQQFTSVPASLAELAPSAKIKDVVEQIKRSNKITSLVQLFAEASTGMAILASLGFPRSSDGQCIIGATIPNYAARALAQSTFWAASVTLLIAMAVSVVYSFVSEM